MIGSEPTCQVVKESNNNGVHFYCKVMMNIWD